jgi:RecA-family ATPase
MKTIDSFTNSNLHQAIHNPASYSAQFFSLQHGDISALMHGEPPQREFLVDKLIPLGVAGLFNGPGAIGKTTLAMQLGASVATGTEFMGHDVQQGSVLMYLSEDDNCEIGQRLHRIKETIPETLQTKMEQNLKILSRPATGLPFFDYGKSSRDATTTIHFDNFFKAAQDLDNLRLIVIDSYTRVNRLDEVQSSHASFTAAWLEVLAQETGATVLMIHHPPKSGSSSARGSSALLNATRFSATLCRGKKGAETGSGEALCFKTEKFNYGKTRHINLERLDNGLLAPAPNNPEESEEQRFLRVAKSIQEIIQAQHMTSNTDGMNYSQLRSMAKIGGHINIQQDRLKELLAWAVHEKQLMLINDRYFVPKQPTQAVKPISYETI